MKQLIRLVTSLLLVSSLSIPVLGLADEVSLDNAFNHPQLEDGQAAFNRGNYELAFSLWQTLATQGHSDAQVFVGLSYANGWGVNKSLDLARHWYRKAALNENASGQFLLGLHYININGKNGNLATGIMWLRKAADNGDLSAQRFLKKAQERGWFDNHPPVENKSKPTVASLALSD